MFCDFLRSYPARPSLQELTEAISYLEMELLQYQDLSAFTPEFLEFLDTGDISCISVDGKMTKEMYEKTHHYVFCTIEVIRGKSVLARYLSGKQFSGFIPPDSALNIQRGPSVIKHEDSKITEWIPLDQKTTVTLGGLFNAIASKSK